MIVGMYHGWACSVRPHRSLVRLSVGCAAAAVSCMLLVIRLIDDVVARTHLWLASKPWIEISENGHPGFLPVTALYIV